MNANMGQHSAQTCQYPQVWITKRREPDEKVNQTTGHKQLSAQSGKSSIGCLQLKSKQRICYSSLIKSIYLTWQLDTRRHITAFKRRILLIWKQNVTADCGRYLIWAYKLVTVEKTKTLVISYIIPVSCVCVCFLPACWNMTMVCGVVWTGRERVRCTELWVRLGMLLLPPGLANHRPWGEYFNNNIKGTYWNGNHPCRTSVLWWQKSKPPPTSHLQTSKTLNFCFCPQNVVTKLNLT